MSVPLSSIAEFVSLQLHLNAFDKKIQFSVFSSSSSL